MNLSHIFKESHPTRGAFEIIKYIGPGLLVTVGFIDPGNWASNVAAGSSYGYTLLWMVTLSTIMLILLQHNAAHLGIVTGQCISEAAARHMPRWVSAGLLISACLAAISTALAEILGAAIGLNMLFRIPIPAGAAVTVVAVLGVLLTNGYRRLEKIIIGFVSIVGLSFLYEISLVQIDWPVALKSWVTPAIPEGALPIVMSVLGAVVMPHNLFLHSEIIQSRQWNLEGETAINRQLRYEFLDTLFAMVVGWAINSAMILMAAAAFFTNSIPVSVLPQAKATLEPLLGQSAAAIFACALLFSGFSSSITAAMAGGSIFAGIFGEPYDIKDKHSRMGVLGTLIGGTVIILFLTNPFQGLIWSQIALSIQLPFTVFGLIFLTSSKRVMGKWRNTGVNRVLLGAVAVIVSALNLLLLMQIFSG